MKSCDRNNVLAILNLFEFICCLFLCSLFCHSVAWMWSWLVCNTYTINMVILWVDTRPIALCRYLLLYYSPYWIHTWFRNDKIHRQRERKLDRWRNQITWPVPKQYIHTMQIVFLDDNNFHFYYEKWRVIQISLMDTETNVAPPTIKLSYYNLLKSFLNNIMRSINCVNAFIQLWLNVWDEIFVVVTFIQTIVTVSTANNYN